MGSAFLNIIMEGLLCSYFQTLKVPSFLACNTLVPSATFFPSPPPPPPPPPPTPPDCLNQRDLLFESRDLTYFQRTWGISFTPFMIYLIVSVKGVWLTFRERGVSVNICSKPLVFFGSHPKIKPVNKLQTCRLQKCLVSRFIIACRQSDLDIKFLIVAAQLKVPEKWICI